jgi:hypothetical protein
MIDHEWLKRNGERRFYDAFEHWDFKTAEHIIVFVDHDKLRIVDTWEILADCSRKISAKKSWYIVPKSCYAREVFRNARRMEIQVGSRA